MSQSSTRATMSLLVAATSALALCFQSSVGSRFSRAGVPIAALSEPPSATGEFPADLAALTRRELQQLAKRMGVRANQKSVDMVAELEALPRREAGSAAEWREASAAQRRSEQSAPARRDARAPERRVASTTERREVSPSPAAAAAGTPEPALPPLDVRQGSLSLVERALPPMLTPSRCEAGRWQPLRLVGEGVELTLLVRDTGTPLEEVLHC